MSLVVGFTVAKDTLLIILKLTSLSVILASFEWLSLYKHFRADGIFSWDIQKIWAKKNKDWFALSFDLIFKYPAVLFLIGSQLLVALLIFFLPIQGYYAAMGAGYLAMTNFLLTYRGVNGFNGADSTTKIVLAILTVSYFVSSIWAFQAALIFISFQLILAYFTPGYLRLAHENWRNGKYLRNILRLETFGNRSLLDFADRYKQSYRFLSWVLIIFECSAILLIFVPLNWLIIWLCCAFVFHLLNAVVMGLNNFPLAFSALYPAIIWLNIAFHQLIRT